MTMSNAATHSLRKRLLWFVLAAILGAAVLQAGTAYRGALQQADAMFDEHLQQMARSLRSGDLLPELMRHAWPGNVRELRNYIEACIVRQEVATTAPSDAPTIDVTQPLRVVREQWTRHVERRYLEQLLLVHNNNVSAAARAAGIDRVHLHRLLSRVGLR